MITVTISAGYASRAAFVCKRSSAYSLIRAAICAALAVHEFASAMAVSSSSVPKWRVSSKANSGAKSILTAGRRIFSSANSLSTSKANVNNEDSAVEKAREVPPGGTEFVSKIPPQPTLAQLMKFALPCLALWISGPLLSLVDTATVGLSAAPGTGAAQLGALGPATTFIDGSTYLFAFLNVATTNLYASALAQAGPAKDRRQAGDGVARTAARVSLYCGFLLMFLLWKVGKPLLKVYIGSEAADQGILDPAAKYVWVRAFSMPTSLLGGVLQASLLGAKDSITPLIAVAYSTVFNVLGDLFLVCKLGMGSYGAAFATLVAQWAGTAAMIGPARRELFAPRSVELNKYQGENRVSARSFLVFAAPVLTLILGKIAAFGVMTHVAAALEKSQPASLAAHQIVLSLFFFVSPFLEVISQTAQAFLPQYFVSGNNGTKLEGSDREAQILSMRLLRLGCAVASIVAVVASSVPRFFPRFLTNDATVQSAVRPLALPLALGALLTAPVAVSEGVLLARRELTYLAGVYIFSTAVFPFALFTIKQSLGPVVNVWFGFAAFQLFRALCFTGRLWGPLIWKSLTGCKNFSTKVSTTVEASELA